MRNLLVLTLIVFAGAIHTTALAGDQLERLESAQVQLDARVYTLKERLLKAQESLKALQQQCAEQLHINQTLRSQHAVKLQEKSRLEADVRAASFLRVNP